jgi:hypothetical protein
MEQHKVVSPEEWLDVARQRIELLMKENETTRCATLSPLNAALYRGSRSRRSISSTRRKGRIRFPTVFDGRSQLIVAGDTTPTPTTAFLARRCEHELPDTMTTLLTDSTRRAGQLGHARVIECADPAVAALISRDRSLRPLCRLIGDRHLAVAADQEPKFRKAVLKLGYVMPVRQTARASG